MFNIPNRSYVIIPGIAIAMMALGKFLTQNGMTWYKTLILPSITPPGWFISIVWTIIYTLTTLCVLIIWDSLPRTHNKFWIIIGSFGVNAFLNVAWSYLFFYQHMIKPALIDAGLLGLSVVWLIYLIWPISQRLAYLLVPYAAWVSFAAYLNYSIWLLNKEPKALQFFKWFSW